MSTQDVTDVQVPGRVIRPPEPGDEVAGPALVSLVQELRAVTRATQLLYEAARRDVRYRFQTIRTSFQCDGNGDGAALLFEIPQGASGALTWLAVDEGSTAITPAAPDTSANLFHGIYSSPGGLLTQVQVIAKGNLLACSPNAPTPDAQIPYTYVFGDQKAAPRLRGPEAFWFAVDAAAANAQVIVRGVVCVEQPEA